MPLVKYGGVLMKIRSPAWSPSVRATWPALLETARSVWQTPLGRPVVPEVNMIIASSSSRTATSSSAEAAGTASPPAARTPSTRPSASAVTTSRTGPSPGVGQASSSGSTITSGRDLPTSQSTSLCGRLVLSGTTTCPASQAPSMQTKNWSYSSSTSATRAPRRPAAARRAAATRVARASTSAYA